MIRRIATPGFILPAGVRFKRSRPPKGPGFLNLHCFYRRERKHDDHLALTGISHHAPMLLRPYVNSSICVGDIYSFRFYAPHIHAQDVDVKQAGY